MNKKLNELDDYMFEIDMALDKIGDNLVAPCDNIFRDLRKDVDSSLDALYGYTFYGINKGDDIDD